MKKFVGYVFVAMLLLMTTSMVAREGDRDEDRSAPVKEKTHHVVKMQKDGKIIVVTKQSNRALTKRDQRKMAEIRKARAKAVPQNAYRKITARGITTKFKEGKVKARQR